MAETSIKINPLVKLVQHPFTKNHFFTIIKQKYELSDAETKRCWERCISLRIVREHGKAGIQKDMQTYVCVNGELEFSKEAPAKTESRQKAARSLGRAQTASTRNKAK